MRQIHTHTQMQSKHKAKKHIIKEIKYKVKYEQTFFFFLI